MCPTRELAIQVAEEIEKLGRFKGIRSLPIYGGQDIVKQIRALKKKPQIIIGTPGRLLDHINRKTIKLDDVQTVILDEADEMLDMGFMDDIQSILEIGTSRTSHDVVLGNNANEHSKIGSTIPYVTLSTYRLSRNKLVHH